MRVVAQAMLEIHGLEGDHAPAGKRALTLLQAEHLPVIAALSARDLPDPALLRRNMMISGINLATLREVPLRLGAAVIRITGPCAPCSRMEAALGPGGYNAMRGHGGWTAEVIVPGLVAVGDALHPQDAPDTGAPG